MPKVKMPRSSPSLDMTPMVDLAFLLVTFFMLTTQFRAAEPVIVDTPSSISEKILPTNVMLVTIDPDGRAFYNIDGKEVRLKTLERMGQQYKVKFTNEEKNRFSVMTSFGVPMEQLKEYVMKTDPERLKVKTLGIPRDSLNNQLGDWINFGRIEAAKEAKRQKDAAEEKAIPFKYEPMRFAIKGDGKASYRAVKEVIEIFKKQQVFRFNLITNLEAQDK